MGQEDQLCPGPQEPVASQGRGVLVVPQGLPGPPSQAQRVHRVSWGSLEPLDLRDPLALQGATAQMPDQDLPGRWAPSALMVHQG